MGASGVKPAGFGAMMAMRGGFVLSLVLGLGRLVGIWSWSTVGLVHILAGAVVLGAMVAVAVATMSRGKRPVAILGGAALGAVGALVGLAAGGELARGLVHLAAMTVAVGGAEMGYARFRRGK